MKRILYLGQKPIGEKCFKILQNAENLEIAGIVSNDHLNAWWKSNNIFHLAKQKNIPFISNQKRNNEQIEQLIIKYKINTIISVQHSWILTQKILSLVNYFAFNLHNAKLPDYKGYNTYNHAILNEEKFYTSTVHWMVEKVDMGAISFEETFKIKPEDTAKSLYEKSEQYAEKVFVRLVKTLTNDEKIPKRPITSEGHFYSHHSLDQFREIKDLNDFNEVDKKSRAFYFPPFEPAYFKLNGKKFYIYPKLKYSKKSNNLEESNNLIIYEKNK